jgi:hypothetical protein
MNFDFRSLCLPTTFEQGSVIKKLITTIPLKKPKSGLEFFRIREEPEWTTEIYLLDLGSEEEKYAVAQDIVPEIIDTGRLRRVRLYTGITLAGNLFLSDISLPDSDGKENEYNRTRAMAYEIAKYKWIKLQVNKALQAYEIVEAKSNLPEPIWPEEPSDIIKALEICFKDKLIDSIDYPPLKKLRGEL